MLKRITLLLLISTSISISPILSGKPIGLRNCGNSCFFNAALQSILTMDSLTQALMKEDYLPRSISSTFKQFLCWLDNTNRPVLSVDLLAHQSWRLLDSAPYSQQDAEEFVSALLNKLLDEDSTPRSSSPSTESSKLICTTLTSHIGTKEHIEPFPLLSLPIKPGDSCLNQCLDHFFAAELVSLRHKTLYKQYSVKETPHYLLFGLKRTYYDTGTQNLAKHRERISFPLVGLNLRPYEEEPTSKQYSLIAIIMHEGSATCGHYIAYVKQAHQWYFCNDSQIHPVTNQQMQMIVQQGSAYRALPTLLIYEQAH